MSKKLTFDYVVHRGSHHEFSLPVTLQNGDEVDALVHGFEVELVPVDLAHGTIRFSFPGSSAEAELFEEGKTVRVTVSA